MSSTMLAAAQPELRPTFAADAGCDLCGSHETELMADASAGNGRVVMCRQCRLMYVSPRPSAAELDAFYDQSFSNDHGARAKVGTGLPDPNDLRKDEHLALHWGLKIIRCFMAVKGKRILDLRCRSGALSAALVAEDADVISIDPFEANLNHARQIRGLSQTSLLPFSRFAELPAPADTTFDAVSMLSHHVLAHVPSPQALLDKIFGVLKPGGYLFLDEKDVLRPARHKLRSMFDTGHAHLYHLTLHTTARYVRSAGFEILECEVDKERKSTFRHIRVVARKPESQAAPMDNTYHGPSAKHIRGKLWWLEQTWQLRHAQRVLKRATRRLRPR